MQRGDVEFQSERRPPCPRLGSTRRMAAGTGHALARCLVRIDHGASEALQLLGLPREVLALVLTRA